MVSLAMFIDVLGCYGKQINPPMIGNIFVDVIGALVEGVVHLAVHRLSDPLVHPSPSVPRHSGLPHLGFFNTIGPAAEPAMAADREAIAPFFQSIAERYDEPPYCDVLFLYGSFASNGCLQGYEGNLRKIMRVSGASLVVVATELRHQDILTAMQESRSKLPGLVLTLRRRGDLFPRFFQRLFTEMRSGASLKYAWSRLVQVDMNTTEWTKPEAHCLCEFDHFLFPVN